MNFSALKTEKGFTLLELIIAVSLLFIITFFLYFSFNSLVRQVGVSSTTDNILSTLNLARSQDLNSIGEYYGVHFETSQYVLFKGTDFSNKDYSHRVTSNDKVYPLRGVSLNSITINGGGSDVVFDTVDGTTLNYGSLVVQQDGANTKTTTIKISASGQAGVGSSTANGNTRLVDARHLRVCFSTWDTTSVNGISFASNSGATNPVSVAVTPASGSFDWSGVVTVAGSSQNIEVHTIDPDSLCATKSISIHRDRDDRNDVDLKVSVSTNSGGTPQLVVYPSSCTVSTSLGSCATKGTGVDTITLE